MTTLTDDNGEEVHCVSCHEDHDWGMAPYDELWEYPKDGSPCLPEKQYCCCAQARLAEIKETQ